MSALADPNLEANLNFGRIAVENGLLNREQMSEAMMKQMLQPGRSVGQILEQEGTLTAPQVVWIVSVLSNGSGAPPATQEPVSTSVLAPSGPAPAQPDSTPARLLAVGGPDLIHRLVEYAVQHGASDLHMHSGTALRLRIDGDLSEEPESEVSSDVVDEMLDTILGPSDKEALKEKGQIDFSYTVPGVARLRCNAYRQRLGAALVVRIVSAEPPTLEALGLPKSLERLASFHQGIVLLTGPAGCGKSSTLAALVALINEQRPSHILTIEDPIEFLHTSKASLVNQRQVKHHTETFARALRAALREDPDVIVIGELRDLETISLALSAAETGHLVLGTMHTMSAIATINRLIGAFPSKEQAQIRTLVSESLRAVASQRLVKLAHGDGRVPALEILICNTAVANLVREQKTFQIPSILQSGVAQGMCMLDASLAQLVRSGTVNRKVALEVCENPKLIPG